MFSTVFAVGLLGETPSPLAAAGIALVVFGALARYVGREGGLLAALRQEPGSLMTVGVAAAWSVSTSLDRLALEHASAPVHAALQVSGVGVVLLVWLTARGVPRRLPRAAWPALAASVGFATLALALQLWAITLLLVGLVETLKRAVGMTAAVGLGRVLFREPVDGRAFAAVVIMTVGAVLAALG